MRYPAFLTLPRGSTYWTYSYSPLQDDDGTVRGVFTAVRDTTEQVVGRRRLAVLQDLGALAGQARSVTEACDLGELPSGGWKTSPAEAMVLPLTSGTDGAAGAIALAASAGRALDEACAGTASR